VKSLVDMPPMMMSPNQIKAAAEESNLDVDTVKDEEELKIWLEVEKEFKSTGTRVQWYWQETKERVQRHEASMVFDSKWVQYSDVVAAQLEFFWQRHANSKGVIETEALVEIDIGGRVISLASKAKIDHLESGSRYVINLKEMKQKNLSTDYERGVLRRVIDRGSVTTGGISFAQKKYNQRIAWRFLQEMNSTHLDRSMSNECSFIVLHPEKTLLFTAESKDERSAWLDTLIKVFSASNQKNIGAHRDSTSGTHPSSPFGKLARSFRRRSMTRLSSASY